MAAMKKPGIVFMGTPEFAVASLDAIVNAGFSVKAVITAPDKPSGRGLQLHASPVKEYALNHSIPVLQPLKLKDPEFLDALRQINADLLVIVAFRMLPEEVWNMPPLGTFNLHASLLPQYRGAAPINWAVINGEKKTGVTTFFLNHEIDKGSVIYRKEVPIGENDTAGDIHDLLMKIGAELVVQTIRDIAADTVKPIEQHEIEPNSTLMPAPKIFKNDCRINWSETTHAIHNLVRGLSPYPAAWSELHHESEAPLLVKIYQGHPVAESPASAAGTIVSDGKSFLKVSTADGYYQIDTIQLQGKKQMATPDFLRGFPEMIQYRFK